VLHGVCSDALNRIWAREALAGFLHEPGRSLMVAPFRKGIGYDLVGLNGVGVAPYGSSRVFDG